MNIVVTTPTGHIGSRIVERLTQTKNSITLLARNPDKLAAFAKRGAKVRKGTLTDRDYLCDATKDADILFWLTPPNPTSNDFRAYQRELAANAAYAIETNKIRRVVNLSSIGAQVREGVGPVTGLREVEKTLNKVAPHITHLRPAMFMENMLNSLATIQEANSIFMPLSGQVHAPFIATHDIANVAADVLLDENWIGQRSITLYGPQDLSFDTLTDTLSRVLERKIKYVQVTPDDARRAMTGMGISNDVADLYLEMYRAAETGLIMQGLPFEPGMRVTTTFEKFARETIRPLIKAS